VLDSEKKVIKGQNKKPKKNPVAGGKRPWKTVVENCSSYLR
jgi:hypothetical protein